MLKHLLVVFGLLFLTLSINAQEYFFNDTIYKYIVPNEEPSNNWKSINFDDSQWNTGKNSIGFGNKKDSTKLSTTANSLFIRYPFTITNPASIQEASLLLDYDDGFVAYLNGIEIVRVNMGKQGETVAYNRLSDRSHEPANKANGIQSTYGYYIDSSLLHKAIVEGKNVLAVQVHNDSIMGSDIHFDCYMFNLTNRGVTPYDGPWHVIKQTPLDSTHLPIISIETDAKGIYSQINKLPATMTVFDNPSNGYNKLTDIPTIICNIGIKLRGNSTLDWPKKNYSVETRDGAGNNLDVSLLGLPAENDWVFNGPFADKSQIRNMLAFSFGKQIMKGWTPRTKFFELVVNGELLGLYILIETIKRDSNRVDIKKLKPIELSGNDLTGGYIMKMDQNNLEVVYPKSDVIKPEQKSYASSAYWGFTTAARSKDPIEFIDPVKGYKKRLDINSYIDYTIVNELVKNADAYQFSMFMHKDRDDVDSLFKFGPLWDHDLSCGNIHVQNANKANGWQFNESVCFKMYHKYVFRDTSMVNRFKSRWFELRKTILHKDSVNKRIDSLVTYAGDALKRNYEVWPYDGKKMEIWGYQHPAKTYIEDIAMMKTYLSSRIDWIDNNITKLFYAMPIVPITSNKTKDQKTPEIAFPNPFNYELKYNFTLQNNQSYTIELYSFTGHVIYRSTNTGNGSISGTINTHSLSSGLYYFIVKNNETILFSQLVAKE